MHNYNVIILVIFSLYNVTILYYNVTIANNEFYFLEVASMTNYKFSFHCVDNGGKHQAFTVSAPNKAAAIEKAIKKARKNAAGDICGTWEIRLQPSF